MMMMMIMIMIMMIMIIDDYDETSDFLCSLLKDRPCYFLRRMGALETHPGEAWTTKASVAQLRNKVDRGVMQEQWDIIMINYDIQKQLFIWSCFDMFHVKVINVFDADSSFLGPVEMRSELSLPL